MILRLALKSLRNRKLSVTLTVLSIALSVLLLLGVERVRDEARGSFTATVSGTDLIVGARTSPMHLLLYSVFHVGYASNNLRWDSYRTIAERPEVAWAIPLSMGDTHRGYRVVGTTAAFLEHFRFAQGQRLRIAQGNAFTDGDEALIGADVARRLGYAVGHELVLAHGAGEVSFIRHDEHPFRVTGVLAATGTPVDRAIYVSLAGLAAIHAEPPRGAPADPLLGLARSQDGSGHAAHGEDAGQSHRSAHDGTTHTDEHPRHAEPAHPAPQGAHAEHDDHGEHAAHASRDAHDDHDDRDHHAHAQPGSAAVTAVLVGLKSRSSALGTQRALNEFAGEPLTAILPGPTLEEVWEVLGAMEKTLFAVSLLVVLVGLAGMLVALLAGLNERRREMAILRAVGARPGHVFALILGEAGVLTLAGIALGLAGLYAGLLVGRPWLEERLGLFLPWRWPSLHEGELMLMVAAAGFLIGLIPAYRTYRHSLADGMTVRT